MAVPAIPTEVPKYPVLHLSQLVGSPRSKRLSTVGIKEEAILEFMKIVSEVVASPRVVLPVIERVPVAVMFATLVMFPEMKTFPWTEKVWDGEVVPTPTFPVS